MIRVYLETYGCTLNQSDSDVIRTAMTRNGMAIAKTEKNSDVVILNTCTVKGATENKILARIKKIVRNKKPLVVAGCLSVNERLIKRIAPGAAIIGTSSIAHLHDAINDALNGNAVVYKNRDDKEMFTRSSVGSIARIPICEGCTSNCYFCQTKIARPFLFSYAPKTIMRWIEDAITHGVKEIQLTAMDSGVYGIDNKTSLPALLHNICEIKGDFKVRLGMINPQHATQLGAALIDALAQEKMYKFIHIPVQSGSEKVCREMNRQHTVADFTAVVKAARARIPNITIATDIIVGYPTETEDDFEQTISFIKSIKPDVVNLSKFSPREGTVAKKMKQLPTQVIKARSAKLVIITRQVQSEKNKAFVGKTVSVLMTERQNRKNKDYTGRTAGYNQVVVKNYKGKLGKTIQVKILSANYGWLVGVMHAAR